MTERIAKRIANAGVCSRRDAEKLIEAGRVSVNGEKILSPALNVSEKDHIAIDGKAIAPPDIPRLWLYHKPTGLTTTHKDERGRPTVFDNLSKDLPRVISVGRLDLNSEGLLLLTNNGDLARKLEHPSAGLARVYRVRVFGMVTRQMLEKLKHGITVAGIHYGSIEAVVDSNQGRNAWLTVTLAEGKNREIRKVFEHFDCRVNRLIRISYGPFKLGELKRGEVEEVCPIPTQIADQRL